MFSLKISCAAHLMLCNCLSSRSCLSLSCSGWLSVQMTLSETETARTPSKSKIFTLSFNTLPFCLSSQARTTKKNKKARSQLLTIASTFNYLHLLQLLLANCILLQEVLPKQSNKQKNPQKKKKPSTKQNETLTAVNLKQQFTAYMYHTGTSTRVPVII